MRTLTINRTKSSINNFYKLQVYIQDDQGDTTLQGAQYRFLGEVKNGESRIFQIDENARNLFVFFTNSSKNYCNDTYPLPAGTEDVILSGKCVYNPATGNAFRFDGEATEAMTANRKRSNKAGIFVLIGAIVVGLVIGFWRAGLFEGKPDPKTFTIDEMSITLTEDFDASTDIVDYKGYFESFDTIVIVMEEKFNTLGNFSDCTIDEYAELVILATELPASTQIHHDNGLTWFEYDATDDKTYNYFTAVYQTDDAFWTVQFVTVAEYADDHREDIIDWAQSVTFDKAA